MEKTIRQRIKTIKHLKEKHGLSVGMIADLSAQYGYVSARTLDKLFSPDSENKKFQYHSIAPVYDALVEKYGDTEDFPDAASMKAEIRNLNRQIDSCIIQMEELIEQHDEKKKLYDERKAVYEKHIALLESQIQSKDKLIKRLMDTFFPEKEA